MKRASFRIGEVLIQHRIITQDQLKRALEEQQRTGQRLGRIVMDSGYATEQEVCQAVAVQLAIPFISLKQFPLDPTFSRRLPEALARRSRALLLQERRGTLLVGMCDPTDLYVYDEISGVLKREISLAVLMESELMPLFDTVYRRSEEISGHARALEQDLGDLDSLRQVIGAAANAQDEAPVAKLVQSLFEEAVQMHASDVHIEPQEQRLNIRLRVNGMLQMQTAGDPKIAPALAQRLKLIAGLDIAERRLPQDGRFQITVRQGPVDVRISTMPTPHGESVVMRLLNHAGTALQLDRLGMPDDMLARLKVILGRSSGMLVVTGPTGSGKTSTLYSAVSQVNDVDTKIVTVEDPIEYRLSGITQVQVNEKIELTFARVLRSVLRHDPDVILVGEMRDQETAQVGMRAAMTGHMVLTTLHTRDAASTPMRLLDMGVPSYLVAVSLQAVIAQRLVRLICDHCRANAELSAQEEAWLASTYGEQAKEMRLKQGAGCSYCHHSGYMGRVGIYEMLEMTADLTALVSQGDASAFLAAAHAQLKGKTLFDHASRLLESGQITLNEVMRLNHQLEE